MTQAKDKRIEKGQELLAAYQAAYPNGYDEEQIHDSVHAEAWIEWVDQNARYFLYDLPQRIEEGRKLLDHYEQGATASVETTEEADEVDLRYDDLQSFMAENAHYFLYDLPQRIEELEEALKYYADTFCELGPYHECCGRLTSDECSGCRAASLLSKTETPVEETDDSGRTFIDYNNRVSDTPPQVHGDVERVARAIYEAERGGADSHWIKTDAFSKGIYLGLARAALAEMRPVSVDREKIAEIRARHNRVDAAKRFGFSHASDPHVEKTAHADREWLLSAIDGGNDD